MLVARTLSIVALGLLLTLAGCALPHAANHGRDLPDGSTASKRGDAAAQESYETLIRVDQEGNVYRDEDAAPPAAANSTATPARSASARRNTAQQSASAESPSPAEVKKVNFDELAEAIDAPQVDAARVAELVAAHARSSQDAPATPAARSPDFVEPVAEKPAATAAATKKTEVTPNATNIASLPPGVFPTVVRATRFELEYDDKVLGEGGIAKVELYGTRDAGRTWDRLGEDADHTSPYTVEMPEEGVYGFRIAVAGKNGLASRPPQNGELPELWVRVDLSEPIFRANLRPAGEANAASEQQAAAVSPSDKPVPAAQTNSAKPLIQQSPQSAVVQASHLQEVQPAPPSPADWKSHLAQAIAAVESQLASPKVDGASGSNEAGPAPTPLTDEDKARLSAQLRMLYLAAGRHDDAIKSSAEHDIHQNEFWGHQMLGLKLLVEPTQAPAARQASAALAEFRDATDKLAAMSELQVKSLSFCTAANSFGVYETKIEGGSWKHSDYSQRKFEPEQPIVLYFEVASFASEQTTSREYPDGAWRTSLRGSYTIVDSSGSPVEQRELKLKDDVCRNRRHDYYVAYKSWIPKLNPGQYSLELLVEDTIAAKIGTSSIDFEVVAP